ncbi:MAG: tetratricopeptide repeat-containing serine protease family protein [Cyanobacteria bacterium P01_G01_bin.54]
MKRRWWTVLGGSILLGLSGCGQLPLPQKTLDKAVLIEQIELSVVRISYGDQAGQGTGFIIDGEPGVCTVATAAHVVKPSELISVSTHDSDTVNQRPYSARAVQMWPNNLDLAIVTFDAPGEGCPYPSLPLGDSGQISKLDTLYLFGFPEGGERALYQQQVAEGQVSGLDEGNAEGYDITYTSSSAAGMSGGPLVNGRGEVIGVHGREEAGFRLAIPIAKFQGQLAAMLAQLPEVAAGTAEELYERGKELLDAEKYEEALEFFDRVVAQKPNYTLAWFNRGISLERLSMPEEALLAYSKTVELEPDFANAWYGRGFTLNELGKYEEAIASYDKALEINPDFAEAWFNRGVLLDDSEKYEEAIASYDKALEINPDFAEAWSNRGVSLRRLERYEEAIVSYDRAIEINPNHSFAWNNRGGALMALGRYQEALDSVEKAIQFDPNNDPAKRRRETILEKLNQSP